MPSVVQNPNFEAPKMPPYLPYDRQLLNTLGTNYDTSYYQKSDTDFKKRHPGLLKAENLFENQTVADMSGDTTLAPQIQGEFMRSGLAGALGAFGDTTTAGATSGGTLAPGSAGEASVARNLGVDIMGFQDRNRKNRLASLVTAESLFPRRSFGLAGADVANIELANTLGQNNWNQADYATRFQVDELNWLNEAQNRQADVQAHNQGVMANAQKKGAIWSGVINSLGSLIGGVAGSASSGAGLCWVAREIFGSEEINGTPKWILFRDWMLNNAPMQYVQAYAQNGIAFAAYLRDNLAAQNALRPLFESRL